MTRPTARVLALLEILQSGGTRTVADLSARLGVDERTVRRYAAHLVDLDIPVVSVRGRYGGYRLAPGYRLPPLMFTDEEALAVLVGLLTGRHTGLAGTSVAAVESAAAKLRRVLPAPLADRLDALRRTAEFTAPAAAPPRADTATPEAGTLLLLAEAARERRPVRFDHTGADGRLRARVVRPYGIVAHSGRWYLTGHDTGRDAVRTFRLDRIDAPAVLPGTFDVPDGFEPAERVLAGLAATPWRHRVSLRVRASEAQVRSRLPASVATVRPAAEPGWLAVELRAERLDWIPGVLAGLAAPFTIERPDELRDLVRALADRLAAGAEPYRGPRR